MAEPGGQSEQRMGQYVVLMSVAASGEYHGHFFLAPRGGVNA